MKDDKKDVKDLDGTKGDEPVADNRMVKDSSITDKKEKDRARA